jgi:hypothetical protein
MASCVALAACGGHKTVSTATPTSSGAGRFFALDAQHQRLVADYEPVSRQLYDYEVAFRNRQAGAISANELRTHALDLRSTIRIAARRVKADAATGATAMAKRLLVGALDARSHALDDLIDRSDPKAYRRNWDRSVVLAREALTKLQDIRDRARLIPLPEDSVS